MHWLLFISFQRLRGYWLRNHKIIPTHDCETIYFGLGDELKKKQKLSKLFWYQGSPQNNFPIAWLIYFGSECSGGIGNVVENIQLPESGRIGTKTKHVKVINSSNRRQHRYIDPDVCVKANTSYWSLLLVWNLMKWLSTSWVADSHLFTLTLKETYHSPRHRFESELDSSKCKLFILLQGLRS